MVVMTREYQIELRDVIATFSVTTPTSYVLGGRSYGFTLDQGNADAGALSNYFISHLGSILYMTYHCRQESYDYHRLEMSSRSQSYHDNREFIESLSTANRGQGTWEPGWEIRKYERNGQIAVHKDGLTLWIFPQQFIPNEFTTNTDTATATSTAATTTPTTMPKSNVGKKGKIATVKEFRTLLPGFYMANGNAPLNHNPPITRIYWDVKASGATILLKHITTELNNENVPFQFKVLNNPNSFTRADAGVLYVNKRYLEKSKSALARVYEHVKPFLKPQVPLFAKKLSQGVSLAEDPNNGESFGQHRSRILAEALYHIYSNRENVPSADEKLAHVSRYFKSQGIDIINRPHLNPIADDKDDYYDIVLKGVFD